MDNTLESCRATLENDELRLTNARLERVWKIRDGLLFASSLRDLKSNSEWLRWESASPALHPPFPLPDEAREVTLSTREAQSPVGAPHLVAELHARGANVTLLYRFRIFPDAMTMQLETGAAPTTETVETLQTDAPSGVETDAPIEQKAAVALDSLDVVSLSTQHLRLCQARFLDQTDDNDELVSQDEWLLHPIKARLKLQGNLFWLEDTLTRNGLLWLKHAPLPAMRPAPNEADLQVRNRDFAFLGHGNDASGGAGYELACLSYQGGNAGRIQALQRYQRQWRAYQPERDGQFLSNTWGDRSRDGRINEAFILQEIEAGARLGVDIVQIDDGWEHGRTANSVNNSGIWNGFWAADPHFWEHDAERFPNGLEPVIQAAQQAGVRIGLWFAPDSSHDFANWQRDAEAILRRHREGVHDFKMDAIKLRTRAGERNLYRFYEHVLRESKGRVTFDQDITAEQRPGYWGCLDAGPLFLENRYSDWHSYWPHQTLRSAWQLAHFVDPLRLRMEFLNHARNEDKYADDPLAPATYSPDYLFAITMFFNPLGWFEASNLPPSYFEQIAPLVQVWKEHRAAISGGTILPIGDAPDGTSWTGFVSVAPDNRSGYALIFRELNAQPNHNFEMPLLSTGKCEILAGNGALTLSEGRLMAAIPRPQEFVFAHLQA